jgi:tetratricopeptide (TPR) repeat protein
LFVLKPAFLTRILMLTGAAVIGWAYLNYALIPVARSAAKIQQASRVISEGEFEVAHNLLADAANEDFLSAAASSVNGRLYLHHFQVDGGKDLDLLSGAKKGLLEAISRNVADFKNFEKLTEVYNDFAELAPQKKGDWLEKAYESAEEAVKRYPNGGHLRIELAEIAEKLGKTDVAIEQYKEAIDIEESYRRQFRQMYPGRAIFSRLGEDKYNFAIERIKELCEKSNR